MDYVDERGENLVRNWYREQESTIRAAFDATLFTLSATEDWTAKHVHEFKILAKEHVGICELVFDIEVKEGRRRFKRHFRPPGIWRPENRDFIILLGCEKSGRIYTPSNAFELAVRYKALFEQGRGIICEHI